MKLYYAMLSVSNDLKPVSTPGWEIASYHNPPWFG